MAEDEKVKVELEMPKDQVSVHAAQVGDDVNENQEALDVLKETNQELRKTKKEVAELKEKLDKSETIETNSGESPVKQATGYELSEIIGAPISAPEPETKSKPKLGQLRTVLVGFAIIFVGLVLWPVFSFSVGLSIIIVGTVFVAIGVLVLV